MHHFLKMIEDLQKRITVKRPKMKQREIVKICLDYISEHPKDIGYVGIAWYDDSKFIINTKIFARFIKRKTNTINRNFRKNGFKCFRTNASMRQKKIGSITFNQLPDSNNWVIHMQNKLLSNSVLHNDWKIDKNEINENSEMSKKLINEDLLFNLNDESYGDDYFNDSFLIDNPYE